MRKSTLLFVLTMFLPFIALSQSCLPDGINFITQSEIYNFSNNYPGCSEIEGDVEISGFHITDLHGLSVLTSIGGDLKITTQGYGLTILTGLNNITSIGGDLIMRSPIMHSFSGLDNLVSIGGDLDARSGVLKSLTGLGNVTTIGGEFKIRGCNRMKSLTGIENLNSIGDKVYIYGNDSLTNLSDLGNVTSIGGDMEIISNDALTSLTGLNNIDAGSINKLFIFSNNSLSTCEVQSICDYLANPNGIIKIFDNATGCNNASEIANSCNIEMPCLPYGYYYFYSQNQIDNFQSNYLDCHHLNGNVYVTGDDITNLYGFSEVTSFGGNFIIDHNGSLKNLSGLENVTSIGGDFKIDHNYSLKNLSEIENVTSIGGNLNIRYNDSLTSLEGLNNLTSIGGELRISINAALTSLKGLDNINSGSIINLTIKYNSSLSTCEVQSVCDYMANPGGWIDIWDNASGCYSKYQVEDACTSFIYDVTGSNSISIYPNPVKNELFISSDNGIKLIEVSIYNQLVQKVLQQHGNIQIIDISMLPQGLYIVELVTEKSKIRLKLVVK